jgi:hypothetical protein
MNAARNEGLSSFDMAHLDETHVAFSRTMGVRAERAARFCLTIPLFMTSG